MSEPERHKRCQHMNCCWRGPRTLCRQFARCIVSGFGCLAHPLRTLARRRHREYVRDDRAGVELVSVQLVNGTATVIGVHPYPTNFPAMVSGDGPRDVKPFHKSWYPSYPTLLAISKALDELENTPKEKQEVRKEIVDKPEEVPNSEPAGSTASTSKGNQQEKEQQYDWDVWSVESLEWNFDDNNGRSGSSPSFG